MKTSFYAYFIVGAICGTKFIPGAIICIVCGVSFSTQLLITFFGGSLGVVIFTIFGELIGKGFRKIKAIFFNKKLAASEQAIQKDSMATKIWTKYGLLGAAILTPPILSPPIGVALALGYKTPRNKIFLYYILSMLIWALIFSIFGKFILQFMEYFGMKHPNCYGLK